MLAAAGAVLLWDVSETVSLPWRLLLGTGVAAGGMAMLWVAFPDSATPFLRRLRKRRP